MSRPAELAHRLYGRQYITCLGQQLGIAGEAAWIAGDISDGRNVRLGELLHLLTSSRAGRIQNNSFEAVQLSGDERASEEIAMIDNQFSLGAVRSEEHTSELQSLMRISYAVFCLKQKNNKTKLKTLI